MATVSSEASAGQIKVFLSVACSVIALIGALTKLPDEGHAIVSTITITFFALYVITDMLWWRKHPWVWLVGPVAIGVAAYWWVGFMAKHGVPDQPLLPVGWYPPAWAYFAMAGALALYAIWDIIDANMHRYRDEKSLKAGAVVLLVGVSICLFLTIRGPRIGERSTGALQGRAAPALQQANSIKMLCSLKTPSNVKLPQGSKGNEPGAVGDLLMAAGR